MAFPELPDDRRARARRYRDGSGDADRWLDGGPPPDAWDADEEQDSLLGAAAHRGGRPGRRAAADPDAVDAGRSEPRYRPEPGYRPEHGAPGRNGAHGGPDGPDYGAPRDDPPWPPRGRRRLVEDEPRDDGYPADPRDAARHQATGQHPNGRPRNGAVPDARTNGGRTSGGRMNGGAPPPAPPQNGAPPPQNGAAPPPAPPQNGAPPPQNGAGPRPAPPNGMPRNGRPADGGAAGHTHGRLPAAPPPGHGPPADPDAGSRTGRHGRADEPGPRGAPDGARHGRRDDAAGPPGRGPGPRPDTGPRPDGPGPRPDGAGLRPDGTGAHLRRRDVPPHGGGYGEPPADAPRGRRRRAEPADGAEHEPGPDATGRYADPARRERGAGPHPDGPPPRRDPRARPPARPDDGRGRGRRPAPPDAGRMPPPGAGHDGLDEFGAPTEHVEHAEDADPATTALPGAPRPGGRRRGRRHPGAPAAPGAPGAPGADTAPDGEDEAEHPDDAAGARTRRVRTRRADTTGATAGGAAPDVDDDPDALDGAAPDVDDERDDAAGDDRARRGPVGIGGKLAALTSRRSGTAEDGSKKQTSFWRELPLLIGVALVLTFLIQTFVAKVFVIPSGSMETTLSGCNGCDNDRVLVDKVTYNFSDISPGDVVVFRGPDSWSSAEYDLEESSNPVVRGLQMLGSLVGFAPPDEKDFVKRVIATGGQTVSCCDALNQVMVDGQPLDEPYVYYLPEAGPARQIPFGPVTVPEGELWMMGDSRNNSADSRASGHGPVPEANVIGKVRLIVLPVDRFGGVDSVNPQTTAQAAGTTDLPQPGTVALGMMGALPFVLGRRRMLVRRAEQERFLPVARRRPRWRRSV